MISFYACLSAAEDILVDYSPWDLSFFVILSVSLIAFSSCSQSCSSDISESSLTLISMLSTRDQEYQLMQIYFIMAFIQLFLILLQCYVFF